MSYQSHLRMDLSNITPLKHAMDYYNRSYSNMGANYSVTDLYKPAQVCRLGKRYAHLVDKMGRLKRKEDGTTEWYVTLMSFRGTAIHNNLEYNLRMYIKDHPEVRFNPKTLTGYILERRLWDRIEDRRISGQFDVWYNQILYDWKISSVWKYVHQDFTDYENQVNLYGYLCDLWDIPFKKGYIVLWMSDWQKNTYDKGYPSEPLALIDIPIWDKSTQKEYFHNLVKTHKATEELPDTELPECTMEDRWATKDAYPVMKKGQKKAVRVKGMDTYQNALDFINMKPVDEQKQYYIDKRIGKSTRCEDFCDIKNYCHQYKRMIG